MVRDLDTLVYIVMTPKIKYLLLYIVRDRARYRVLSLRGLYKVQGIDRR